MIYEKIKEANTDGCWRAKGISFGHSSTGVSPRPMLMGASRNALWAFNARVSLTCLYVVAHKLPYLFYGLVFVAHLFRGGPVLRTCNRFLGAPADRLGTDRMYPSALYCAEASRRAFFVKVPPPIMKERNRERVSCFRFQAGLVSSC